MLIKSRFVWKFGIKIKNIIAKSFSQHILPIPPSKIDHKLQSSISQIFDFSPISQLFKQKMHMAAYCSGESVLLITDDS